MSPRDDLAVVLERDDGARVAECAVELGELQRGPYFQEDAPGTVPPRDRVLHARAVRIDTPGRPHELIAVVERHRCRFALVDGHGEHPCRGCRMEAAPVDGDNLV